MSFKRDGDDSSLLETLRKRRIKDLFSEDIPEDEAKLLSNGRFACLVCKSNPIFDTVSMLSVHKKGKKHQHSELLHQEKKNELKQLIAARKHESYLRDGTATVNTAPASNVGGISTASPYDSRVKKRAKLGDRKQILDLGCSSFASKLIPSSSNHACKASDRRDQSNWRNLCQDQLHGPVYHDKQLSNIFKQKEVNEVKLKPYHSSSTNVRNADRLNPDHNAKSSNHNHSLTQYKTDSTYLQDTNKITSSRIPSNKEDCNGGKKKLSRKNGKKELSQTNTESSSSLTAKYRLLQGSGWKKDWDGKWIKEEDAEFDSDEEPPDIP